jgi:hypothetical protein
LLKTCPWRLAGSRLLENQKSGRVLGISEAVLASLTGDKPHDQFYETIL